MTEDEVYRGQDVKVTSSGKAGKVIEPRGPMVVVAYNDGTPGGLVGVDQLEPVE